MIKKLFSLFGKGNASAGCKNGVSLNNREMKDIAAFVDYVVRALVDEPGSVKIEVTENEQQVHTVNINCQQADIGKIIGKSGKTIMAIRSLVTGVASRINRHIDVEVVESVAN